VLLRQEPAFSVSDLVWHICRASSFVLKFNLFIIKLVRSAHSSGFGTFACRFATGLNSFEASCSPPGPRKRRFYLKFAHKSMFGSYYSISLPSESHPDLIVQLQSPLPSSMLSETRQCTPVEPFRRIYCFYSHPLTYITFARALFSRRLLLPFLDNVQSICWLLHWCARDSASSISSECHQCPRIIH
jgi:hypothetical protein